MTHQPIKPITAKDVQRVGWFDFVDFSDEQAQALADRYNRYPSEAASLRKRLMEVERCGG